MVAAEGSWQDPRAVIGWRASRDSFVYKGCVCELLSAQPNQDDSLLKSEIRFKIFTSLSTGNYVRLGERKSDPDLPS